MRGWEEEEQHRTATFFSSGGSLWGRKVCRDILLHLIGVASHPQLKWNLGRQEFLTDAISALSK